MKLRSVDLNDDEDPAAITVTMSVDEAALIYSYTGRTAPLYVSLATHDDKWGVANDEIADCLAGSFFNRFYENGADEVLKVSIEQIMQAKADHLAGG